MTSRESLIAAIEARLEQVMQTQDPQPVLGDAALAEARELTGLLAGPGDDLAARYLLGQVHWFRFAGLRDENNEADWDAALSMMVPCYIDGGWNFPAVLRPILAERAARAAAERLASRRDGDDVTGVVELMRRIVADTAEDHRNRALLLGNLGIALRLQYEQTGAPGDLDAAVETGHEAVRAASPAERPQCLTNLGMTLLDRFERTGSMADLEAAAEAQRTAVATAAGDDPNRATFLGHLGITLNARFERTGDLDDLRAGIAANRAAAGAFPAGHPLHARALTNLGTALWRSFERTGTMADLEESIEAQRAATAATPPGHPDRAMVLSNLSIALESRFDRTGSLDDLEAGMAANRAAVDASTPGTPGRALYLSNLSNKLLVRYLRLGDPADLEAAVHEGRRAVDAAEPGSLALARGLGNLGLALKDKSRLTGSIADLDAAIEALRSAAETLPAGHPERPLCLANLAIALRTRFEVSGALPDLDSAIDVARAAVAATPADHPDRPSRLSTLGGALLVRFWRTGMLADIDAAIEAAQASVDGIGTGHPRRLRFLGNLGTSLQARFERTGSLADLTAAIDAGRACVDATAGDDPAWPLRQSNYAAALRARFDRTGAPADLDEALQASHTAVAAAPAGHPRHEVVLTGLAEGLLRRFRQTGSPADRAAAAAAYSRVAGLPTASPSARIHSARTAGVLLAESDPGRSADLLEAAVRLLGEVSLQPLEQRDQEHELSGFTALASLSAAAALNDPRPDGDRPPRPMRALQLLEAGRAVLLGEAIGVRDDLTGLSHEHPRLAERFARLRDALGQPGPPPDQPGPPPGLPAGSPGADAEVRAGEAGRATEERRRLSGQLKATLAEIRLLEGYGSFGLPPAATELTAQAAAGPVVTFNVDPERSDALLLTPGGVSCVELPGLTMDALGEQIDIFQRAIEKIIRGDAGQRAVAGVLAWLWDTAAEPVLEALGYRETPPPGATWPRVWWSPGGYLGLVPFHAAGHHADAGPAGRTVLDRVISSYTPTIRALRHTRRQTPAQAPPGRALIVAMPSTPGLPGGELPYVVDEVTRVRELLPGPIVLAEPVAGDPAALQPSAGIPTRASVLEHLPGCPIAHFACHGSTRLGDPSGSFLLLHDHARTPLTVASLAQAQLGHLELVYLSACNTAFTASNELLDEAIHLTAAFQLAGARHVVGTLWEIADSVAVDIAAAFYTGLRDGSGAMDTSRAAQALHHAIRAARDQHLRTPSVWAAHVHVGA